MAWSRLPMLPPRHTRDLCDYREITKQFSGFPFSNITSFSMINSDPQKHSLYIWYRLAYPDRFFPYIGWGKGLGFFPTQYTGESGLDTRDYIWYSLVPRPHPLRLIQRSGWGLGTRLHLVWYLCIKIQESKRFNSNDVVCWASGST